MTLAGSERGEIGRMDSMSLAIEIPAQPGPVAPPAPSPPPAAVRPPGNVRGPVILVLVMAVIMTGIGLFVAATEKHPVAPAPAVTTGTTHGTTHG
jgi:hypothetical protein